MPLLVPKIAYFSVLISNHCVHTEKVGDAVTQYTLNVPGVEEAITMTKTSGEKHDSYSFTPDTDYVMDRCAEVNTRVLSLYHFAQYPAASARVQILYSEQGTGQAFIEVVAHPDVSPVYYYVNALGFTCAGDYPQYVNTGAWYHTMHISKVFPNATHIKFFTDATTRKVSDEAADTLLNCLSASDRNIIDSIKRETQHMAHTSQPVLGQFSKDSIISYALYLAVSADKYKPFAMICAMPIFREDKGLFKPCFSLGNAEYVAIGNEVLKSRLVVDESTFVQIVRENPTSRTVCNLLMCLTLHQAGKGHYFDSAEFS